MHKKALHNHHFMSAVATAAITTHKSFTGKGITIKKIRIEKKQLHHYSIDCKHITTQSSANGGEIKSNTHQAKTAQKNVTVNREKARKTALLGILCAQAIALSFLENLIPSLPFLPPGAKPGFSNIVTMFTVLTLGLPQAMCITVFKALFALMTRGATAFFMSLAGGVLSTLAMWAATKIKSDPFGLLGASIIAAVCHNAGQLAAAAVLTGTGAVLGYAPALLIFSLITGAVTGTVLRIVMPALEKQTRFIIKK